MITQTLFVLLGFFSIGALNGIFGSTSFYVLPLLFSVIFFYLSVKKNTTFWIAFLLGICLAVDFTSGNRSGLVVLFGAILVAMSYVNPQILRFTTPLAQVIIGLLILTFLYAFLPFGIHGTVHRFIILIPIFFISSLYSAIVYRGVTDTSYEII